MPAIPRLREQPHSAGSIYTLTYRSWIYSFLLGCWTAFTLYKIIPGHLSHHDLTGLSISGLFALICAAILYEKDHFILNKDTRLITWRTGRIWNIKSGTLHFDDIETVFLEPLYIWSKGPPTHRIVIRCRDGNLLPVTNCYLPHDDAQGKLCAAISDIITGKPTPVPS